MTRRVLIVLALLVGAWFAYGSLAGRKAEATSREPGGGLQDLDALTHVIPAKPAEAAKAPAVPSEGPAALHPKVAELEQNVAQGNRREAIAGALSLAAAQSAEPQFRRLTARTAKMALLAGDPEGAAGVTTALWDNWTMGSLPWPESAPEWDEHQALLRETMSGLLFNPGVAWRSRTYEVSKNDTLDKIRRRVKAKEGIWVESGFLSAVNRVSPTRLQEGQKLRVPIGVMKVVVQKSSFTLKLFMDEVVIRVYRVGLGKDGCTPSAQFSVIDKVRNPVWWDTANGRVVPHGHPENPLGDHFIKLHSDVHKGFGIHGTRLEDRPTIGTLSSEGCIRMLAEDVAELFEFLPTATEVIIR